MKRVDVKVGSVGLLHNDYPVVLKEMQEGIMFGRGLSTCGVDGGEERTKKNK